MARGHQGSCRPIKFETHSAGAVLKFEYQQAAPGNAPEEAIKGLAARRATDHGGGTIGSLAHTLQVKISSMRESRK